MTDKDNTWLMFLVNVLVAGAVSKIPQGKQWSSAPFITACQ